MATEAVPAPVIADPAPVDPTIETTKKPRKPRAPASHPPYIEMIQEAITTLKEKTGSSQYAITKFIEKKHKNHIPPNFKKLLLIHLRKLTAAGKLTKVKNSYKIPAADPVKSKSKVNIAKPKAKQSVKPKDKAVAKKQKTKSIAKLKPVARVSKPKPKTVAAKISEKNASGKKTVKPAAKALGKATGRVAAKKRSTRKN